MVESNRPVGVFLTKRDDIEASALYKLFEKRWNKRLSSALFAFALRSPSVLPKPAEEILSSLFVRKTLRGH
jgi:hypothetical protein